MTPEEETTLLTEGLEHLYSGPQTDEGAALRDWLDDRGIGLVRGISSPLAQAWINLLRALNERDDDLDLMARALLYTAGEEAGGVDTEAFTDDERALMVDLGRRYQAVVNEQVDAP